jgi:phage gp36-like protein
VAYSTSAQVQIAVGGLARLTELTDLENTGATSPIAATVNQAIADADGVINSYLGKRFAVPLATVPDTISMLSARWAARVLRQNKYNGQPLQDDIDREKIDREWLDGVSQGKYSLGIEPVPPKASMVTDAVGPRDPSLLVSRQTMKGFW